MALEEFNHFFQESFVDDKDDTSGTSDFDIHNDNDPDDCYCESSTNTKSVSILYKRWSTKNGEQYKPIAKFWDIVEKHVNASKLQGYGTDWTGYGTDFLYGIIFKDGNIPKEVIDDVKKAFPDMIFDNSFSIPLSFEETYSGDTKNIDSLYDKIWSKGFLSHELEEFTDDGKCTIRVSYKNKVSQESTIPRSNAVYTNGGSIEKINDFPFDKVYFGSPNKLPTTMKLDGPLFVSPYPGIASIFSVRPQNLKKYGVPNGVRCNRDYDEWNRSLIDTVLQKPLRELHVRIQGDGLNIKPTTELVSGYLYTIDVTPDIRDHIYQSSKMSKVFEFCIDKMDSVTFSDIKKINVRMTVTGENIHIQEAYDATTGEEIPIDHAYTMDDMKERTFSFKDLFSKEKRAKRYIEKRITKLLPSFMTDINKLLSAYDNDNLSRKLVMDMYYPRTVSVTHHDPATGAVYTTTEQQPTEEMIRLSCVINFFKKIIKKPRMMDMIDNPDVVYGLREELDTMLNYIYDIFKIKSTKEDLENLFGIITSISNDIDSFVGSFSSNNEVSTMFDSIDYFSDVDVEPIAIQEAKLPSKKRNALDDSDFALVYTDANGKKIRKYPVHDKAHVESAARMFPRGVPLKYQGKVARKILRRAHEFGIDTSGWKNLNKFKESD